MKYVIFCYNLNFKCNKRRVITDDHDRDRDVECDHDHDHDEYRGHDRDGEFYEPLYYVIYTLKKKIFFDFYKLIK